MEVKEIISAAVEPVNKLIEAVTDAIGKAYEPRYKRRMADAKAYEIKVIGDELRNNADLPIVYDTSQNITIDTSDYEALVKRAGKRIAYQEMSRQENIETIVDSAYDSLQGIQELVKGDISREWMHRFLDAAGDISTEDLQKIWSKVLAGEVLDPTTFSLRTLECLRNLDVHDARLFEKLCGLVISNRFIINNDVFLNKHGITYSDIMKLDECGLMNSSGFISAKFSITSKPTILIDFGDYIVVSKADNNSEFSIQQFPLTAAGRELSTIVEVKMDLELIKEMCSIIASENNVELSLHKVNSRDKDNINYKLEPILLLNIHN